MLHRIRDFYNHLFADEPPKFASRIRDAGAALIGLQVASTQLPDVPDSWIVLAQIILAAYLIFKGQYATAVDLVNEANKCEEEQVKKKPGRKRRFEVNFGR